MSIAMKTAEPIHPGEILLEEFLKAYEPPVSQTEAAERLGWSFVRLNQLINQKRGLTAENAVDLAALTGTSSMFWMNLQQRYDLWHAERQRERRGAPKIRPMKKTA
jgi:addiction module HigA family antidote